MAGQVYCSGQLGIDPKTGRLISGQLVEQTRQALCNIRAIIEQAQSNMQHVVKVTLYTTEIEHFAEINTIYADFFTHHLPARSAVGVQALPLGAKIMIDVVAAQ